MKKIRERVLRGDAVVTCFHDMSGLRTRSAETSLGAAGTSARATLVADHLREVGEPALNRRGASSARLRRHTIQVCAPGVSMGVKWMSLDLSQSRNLRFGSIRRSSVPHAIHSRRRSEFTLAVSFGYVVLKSSAAPPALKDATQAKRSMAFRPV